MRSKVNLQGCNITLWLWWTSSERVGGAQGNKQPGNIHCESYFWEQGATYLQELQQQWEAGWSSEKHLQPTFNAMFTWQNLLEHRGRNCQRKGKAKLSPTSWLNKLCNIKLILRGSAKRQFCALYKKEKLFNAWQEIFFSIEFACLKTPPHVSWGRWQPPGLFLQPP